MPKHNIQDIIHYQIYQNIKYILYQEKTMEYNVLFWHECRYSDTGKSFKVDDIENFLWQS